MERQQFPRRLGEAAPGVLALVPFRRADRSEEVLHRRLVAVEQLAIEVSRVPVDQDAAEIEDDDAALCVRCNHEVRRSVRCKAGPRPPDKDVAQEGDGFLDAFERRQHRILVLDGKYIIVPDRCEHGDELAPP